jgi:RNA polymerase sigma-70 factor (ECF subfamily)
MHLHTTQWSQVIAARDGSELAAQAALESLCKTYWKPLFAYVRRRGYSAEEASDLTQAFFAAFLEKKAIAKVRREKGRFRSFLLASLNNFLTNEWHRNHTQRRGGNVSFISLEFAYLNGDIKTCPSASLLSPEDHFRRNWAVALLGRALERLRAEQEGASKQHRFELLEPFLTGTTDALTYEALAGQLGIPVSTAKVTVHRLRKRYGRLIREEIAQTVSSEEDIQEELHELLAAL